MHSVVLNAIALYFLADFEEIRAVVNITGSLKMACLTFYIKIHKSVTICLLTCPRQNKNPLVPVVNKLMKYINKKKGWFLFMHLLIAHLSDHSHM